MSHGHESRCSSCSVWDGHFSPFTSSGSTRPPIASRVLVFVLYGYFLFYPFLLLQSSIIYRYSYIFARDHDFHHITIVPSGTQEAGKERRITTTTTTTPTLTDAAQAQSHKPNPLDTTHSDPTRRPRARPTVQPNPTPVRTPASGGSQSQSQSQSSPGAVPVPARPIIHSCFRQTSTGQAQATDVVSPPSIFCSRTFTPSNLEGRGTCLPPHLIALAAAAAAAPAVAVAVVVVVALAAHALLLLQLPARTLPYLRYPTIPPSTSPTTRFLYSSIHPPFPPTSSPPVHLPFLSSSCLPPDLTYDDIQEGGFLFALFLCFFGPYRTRFAKRNRNSIATFAESTVRQTSPTRYFPLSSRDSRHHRLRRLRLCSNPTPPYLPIFRSALASTVY
ncbi:hypothetical protein K456DRAFT_1143241 [Colletotrichum gloeosporioides 23]|nr:hypothetical protein K456DRAFT_1143241 [Colletotrichum gloeosporioides 23]